MAGDSDENNVGPTFGERSAMADVTAAFEEKSKEEKAAGSTTPNSKNKKKQRGVLSRIWTGVFGSKRDDFERRLERISKEETAILNRMRRRANTWGKRKRQIILLSLFLELIAVGYAIVTARMSENWKIRAIRVFPIFLLPALSSVMYSGLKGFINMREQKDQRTLEKLREERQSKIDELKEKNNYYITQQLIQRYDTDPAAKAAAATVLASKLGSDSGLKFLVDDESQQYGPAGKSNDVETMQSNDLNLRNRRKPLSRATSLGRATSLSRGNSLSSTTQHSPDISPHAGSEYGDNQLPFVQNYQAAPAAYNGGWFSRIAALLVGEDPTQCYALICSTCHMHNGLASREDFPYVTYICPHCRAVNGPRIRKEGASSPNTPNAGSVVSMDLGNANSNAFDPPITNLVENMLAEAADRVDKTEEAAAAAAAGNDS